MKTFLVAYCLSLAVCADAQYGPQGKYLTPFRDYSAEMANMRAQLDAQIQAARLQQTIQNFIPRDPWRDLNGTTNYVKTQGVEFCGKVVDITPDGVRIEGEFGNLYGTYYPARGFSDDYNHDFQDFFVAHFPFEVVNGQIISSDEHLMAWYVGTYTYKTVNNASRTIRKLDYGIPCGPAPKFVQQQIEAAKARAVSDKMKAEKLQISAVRWLQSEATNGDASAQCSLGLHYLNGQGCETNIERAAYWLQKSAAQGYIEAPTNLSASKENEQRFALAQTVMISFSLWMTCVSILAM